MSENLEDLEAVLNCYNNFLKKLYATCADKEIITSSYQIPLYSEEKKKIKILFHKRETSLVWLKDPQLNLEIGVFIYSRDEGYNLEFSFKTQNKVKKNILEQITELLQPTFEVVYG